MATGHLSEHLVVEARLDQCHPPCEQVACWTCQALKHSKDAAQRKHLREAAQVALQDSPLALLEPRELEIENLGIPWGSCLRICVVFPCWL